MKLSCVPVFLWHTAILQRRAIAFGTRVVGSGVGRHQVVNSCISGLRGGSTYPKDGDYRYLTTGLLMASRATETQASESLSIAGSCTRGSFGGLDFRDPGKEYRVLFVLGGPGAGKGTQSDMLLRNYPCVHLSAGDLLRRETRKKNSLHAKMIEQCLVSGQIVPVDVSLSLLHEAMEESSNEGVFFLIDGFPRNFDNLQGWTRRMKTIAAVWGVLVYQCPLAVLESRILERAKKSGRSDDNIESLRKRFQTFEAETVPVINTLRLISEKTSLQVVDISGDQELDAVWKDTQDLMNDIISNDILSANANLLRAVESGNTEAYGHLCSESLLDGQKAETFMYAHEMPLEFQSSQVRGAELCFLSGKRVSLTYERTNDKARYKECRIWSHDGCRWRMVHFTRSPECGD